VNNATVVPHQAISDVSKAAHVGVPSSPRVARFPPRQTPSKARRLALDWTHHSWSESPLKPVKIPSAHSETDSVVDMESEVAVQSNSSSPNEAAHDPGKMFIGGLSWQTAPEGLREYFSKFGEISEVMVMKDPTTRRSRGFGFVTFADPASVEKVLANGPHELDGKKIDPKIAFPKRAHPEMVTRTKKVFVGGLSAPTTLEDVKNYFQQFGRVSINICK